MTPATISDSRVLSGGSVFRVRDGMNPYPILRLAERIKGSIVIFENGRYDFYEPFQYENIASILAYCPTSTVFRRWNNRLFSTVQNYSHNDVFHTWSGFTVQNEVATDEPAIEFGGSSFGTVERVNFVGAAADAIHLVNEVPTQTPPAGFGVGTWTENCRLRDLFFYGYRKAIRTICKDPTGGNNSFSNFKASGIQLGATVPGSVGLDLGPHSNFYACDLGGMKFNLERSCNGSACCVQVGEGVNFQGCIDGYVEGDAPRDDTGAVIHAAGTRIRVASSARVTGHGKFYRQSPDTVQDEIAPSVMRWDSKPGGFVEPGILQDQE